MVAQTAFSTSLLITRSETTVHTKNRTTLRVPVYHQVIRPSCKPCFQQHNGDYHIINQRRRRRRQIQAVSDINNSTETSGSPELPLLPARIPNTPPVISYAKILEQVATSIESILNSTSDTESTRLTVDFPPERSETRAGTLVSRYENNLNFINALVARLNPNENIQSLGPPVEIRDNVNPQGGGEYITDDECMVGIRTNLNNRSISLLINAGVDASTLKQVKQFDEVQGGVVILINCALDKVSWFAKLGFAKYIDSFTSLYYLKDFAPNGWLMKCGLQNNWTIYINKSSLNDTVVLEDFKEKPAIVDVESKIRLANS